MRIYYLMLTTVHKRAFVTTRYYTVRTSLQIGLFKTLRRARIASLTGNSDNLIGRLRTRRLGKENWLYRVTRILRIERGKSGSIHIPRLVDKSFLSRPLSMAPSTMVNLTSKGSTLHSTWQSPVILFGNRQNKKLSEKCVSSVVAMSACTYTRRRAQCSFEFRESRSTWNRAKREGDQVAFSRSTC